MKIQQIRNATLKISYGGITFLLDPWLQDQGTGVSARTVTPAMEGVKCPLNSLTMSVKEILEKVDYCLVTHTHFDHFTPDYLPQDICILTQNKEDCKKIEELGFLHVSAINTTFKIGDVEITKTPALHGDNDRVIAMMGDVTGYLLQGEEKTLYLAGDTVFYEGITETLQKFSPDVIVLNCCEATIPEGRLIMNREDIAAVCNLCPNAVIIATHLDSVNHALLTSDDILRFAQERKLSKVIVPHNGECIQI